MQQLRSYRPLENQQRTKLPRECTARHFRSSSISKVTAGTAAIVDCDTPTSRGGYLLSSCVARSVTVPAAAAPPFRTQRQHKPCRQWRRLSLCRREQPGCRSRSRRILDCLWRLLKTRTIPSGTPRAASSSRWRKTGMRGSTWRRSLTSARRDSPTSWLVRESVVSRNCGHSSAVESPLALARSPSVRSVLFLVALLCGGNLFAPTIVLLLARVQSMAVKPTAT